MMNRFFRWLLRRFLKSAFVETASGEDLTNAPRSSEGPNGEGTSGPLWSLCSQRSGPTTAGSGGMRRSRRRKHAVGWKGR
jgi:hypothetical protein